MYYAPITALPANEGAARRVGGFLLSSLGQQSRNKSEGRDSRVPNEMAVIVRQDGRRHEIRPRGEVDQGGRSPKTGGWYE